jgi:hypothetical protein
MSEELTTPTYTKEDIQKAFPKRKSAITDELVDIINDSVSDPMFQGESLLQSAITYEQVLKGGRYKFSDYVRAVKFCACIGGMNDNYTQAYIKTFYDRDFVKDRAHVADKESVPYKELCSAASRYRRSKLVVDILTYSQVPESIFFAGYRIKAMGVLADMMVNARSEMAKVNAAKELLANTKPSETVKMELDVNVKESTAVAQLNDQLMEMAAKQKMLLETGNADVKEFGAMKAKDSDIIDAEVG